VTDIPFRVEPAVTPGDEPLEYELPRGGRVKLTVRAGERRTGGYRIAVTGIERSGTLLTVRCEIEVPAAGAIVTQVLTSPAQTVSVDEAQVRGVRHAVLVDASGAELGRISA
jgi:PrcB C-terminal